MSAFEYEAIDADGARKTGMVNADTARLARQQLRGYNLVPLSLVPIVKAKASSQNSPLLFKRRHMSAREVCLFTRQLATMLDAGAPLEGALRVLAQQAETHGVKKVLTEVRADVTEGHSLAMALSRQESVFSPFYCSLVEAGESSGSLAAVLDRLAIHTEKAQKIRSKVITTSIYPAALAITAFAVVAALVAFVVPRVVEQFDSMGQGLPGLTMFVIGLSDMTRSYGLIVLMTLATCLVLARYLLRLPLVKEKVDAGLLHLPFVGRLTRDLLAARLSRTLSTLVSCGTPIVDGLQATAKTIENTVVRSAVLSVTKAVQEGKGLSDSLRDTAMFPPLLVYMVAVGESSGRLDSMLSKSADHLEDEFETLTATFLSLLEPAIIIVMGGVVATIVLAILLPILRLNSLALM